MLLFALALAGVIVAAYTGHVWIALALLVLVVLWLDTT